MKLLEILKEQKGDLKSIATKIKELDDIKGTIGNAKSLAQVEKELTDSIVIALSIKDGALLSKSIKDLKKDLNKTIKESLKIGERIGNGNKLPDSVKEISKAIIGRELLESSLKPGGRIYTFNEIEKLVENQKKLSLDLYKKNELTFTNPKAPKPGTPTQQGTPNPTNATTNAVAPVVPPPTNGGGIIDTVLNKLKKAGKIKAGISIASIALVGGVAYYFLSDGSKQPVEGGDLEFIKKSINPCLRPLVKDGCKLTFYDKKPILTIVKTGNAEHDAKGGLAYYPNGRVVSIDKSIRGTWSCKQPLPENKIKLNLLSLLNEEVDEMTLAKDVDTMIDYLDTPVTEDDLKNALELLTRYSTETINGQNAGKLFIKKYYEGGFGGTSGGDIKTSLKYIYTVKETSKTLKNNILALVNQIESGKVATPTKSNSPVNIIWDKDSMASTQPASKVKQQITYKPCETFPFIKGCKNEKIKDVQTKLGFEDKYKTGNFGSITINKLTELGYDLSKGLTQEMYDAIMGLNKTDPSAQPASDVKPDPQKVAEPNYSVEPQDGDIGPPEEGKGKIQEPSSEPTTDTKQETKPQPNNAIREYLLQNINKNLVGNLVYTGAILDDNQDKFLDSYVKEKYGQEYNRDKSREKIGKNRQRTVFKK